jgi:Uncharacterized conserved protein (COG2071).
VIDRRILINYRVDKEVLRKYLPYPFRPKLVDNAGMAGICLIRLKEIRPKGIPAAMGISSENGAHRIAVEWTENGMVKEGVFIPRRDTSSHLNALAGGRVFPGEHHLAAFTVNETRGRYEVAFKSADGTSLAVTALETDCLGPDSIFGSLEEASDFFKAGSAGFSPCGDGCTFEGLELITHEWKVTPLSVVEVHSSFFENKKRFPEGSIAFDNALLMKNIRHEWRSLEQKTPSRTKKDISWPSCLKGK